MTAQAGAPSRIVAAVLPPLVTLVSLLVAASVVHVADGPDLGQAITIGGGLLSYAVAGGLILWHRPRHAVGVLLSLIGTVPTLGYFAQVVAERSSGSVVFVAGLASSLTWMALAGVVVLLAVYPSGRPVSPRWRWIVWLAVIGAIAGALTDGDTLERLSAIAPAWVFGILNTLVLALLIALVAAVVSLFVRFRRGGPRERAQLRLFLAATAGTLAAMPATGPDTLAANVVFGVALLTLPTAIATAVVRHQLYDIDRAVKRTLVYALATALLVGLYAFLVLAVQAVTTSDQSPDVAVAAATLAAAALFRPLVRRIQAVLGRRFNRARYDAQQTADAFATRLRDQVQLADLTDDLAAVVRATVAPTHASLWLREAEA